MAGPDSVFRALADPTRRDIVKLLRKTALSSGEIAARFDATWPTISRHLGILRDAGVITAERNGNRITYELNATVLHELVEHLLDWTGQGGRDA